VAKDIRKQKISEVYDCIHCQKRYPKVKGGCNMYTEKIQVVIADDNKDFNFILSEYLSYQNGIEVVGTAFNGAEAFDLIITKEPDVVVLDIIMPVFNGIEVLEKVNSIQLTKRPLFIMLSALGNDKTTQQALDIGANYYLVKPFDMDVLVKKIQIGTLKHQVI
jgi:two-component system, response regulator, stage 0 sporulation protein A